jgi:hypothetical protein
MLILRLYLRTAWSDYFPGSPTPIQSNEYTSRQTQSGTNVYVLNCLFISITSSSAGGALYCSSVTYFLVESTSFFSCKTSVDHGGAIYISQGQIVLDGICGYDCYSTESGRHGQFVYIGANGAVSNKKYANYSSMVRCVNENSNSYYAFDLFGGTVCYSSVNSSMNKCGYGVNFCNPSTTDTCSFLCCSFVDNIATKYACLYLSNSGPKYEIKSCNILRNTQSSSSYGIISAWGSAIIQDCCILENTATYIFYGSSYTITLSNCTVDKTTNNGYVATKNIVTKSFILALNHMSTQNCASGYDAVGTLIPIIESPSSSKKPKLCYTGHKIYYQLPQGNFFSLISLFIFNFIHPYASYNPLY